jgi:hypothetical protein
MKLINDITIDDLKSIIWVDNPRVNDKYWIVFGIFSEDDTADILHYLSFFRDYDVNPEIHRNLFLINPVEFIRFIDKTGINCNVNVVKNGYILNYSISLVTKLPGSGKISIGCKLPRSKVFVRYVSEGKYVNITNTYPVANSNEIEITEFYRDFLADSCGLQPANECGPVGDETIH